MVKGKPKKKQGTLRPQRAVCHREEDARVRREEEARGGAQRGQEAAGEALVEAREPSRAARRESDEEVESVFSIGGSSLTSVGVRGL